MIKELTKNEIYDRLDQLENGLTGRPNFDLPNWDDVISVYEQLQNETNVQKYNKSQLGSLLDDIYYGLGIGETKQELFIHHGSSKHLNFYDNFLGKGETDKVLQALNDNGLSSDLLKGIKPYKDQDFKSPIDNNFRVFSKWATNPITGSFEPEIFEIYYKGKIIYKWENKDKKNIQYKREQLAEQIYKELMQKNAYRPQQTLVKETIETTKGSYTVNTYKTKTGKIATRKQYAAGTVINGVKVGGRYFK